MTDAQRNRAALAFVAFLAAVAVGTAYLLHEPADPGHVVGSYSATPDAAPTHCWLGPVTAGAEVFGQFFPLWDGGGSRLALAKSCYHDPCADLDGGLPVAIDTGVVPVDDAEVPAPPASYDLCDGPDPAVLPRGVEFTPADETVRPYEPGEPVFEAWVAGHPAAPWRCACGAPGAVPDAGPCEKLVAGGRWAPASVPIDMALRPGRWRGDCARQPCGSWDRAYVPAACCVDDCAGLACGTSRCGRECGACDSGLECRGHRCE